VSVMKTKHAGGPAEIKSLVWLHNQVLDRYPTKRAQGLLRPVPYILKSFIATRPTFDRK
jgi:hypothetical protein